MDIRCNWLLLLLLSMVAFAFCIGPSVTNNHAPPNFMRKIRRIELNEFLVPPPLPQRAQPLELPAPLPPPPPPPPPPLSASSSSSQLRRPINNFPYIRNGRFANQKPAESQGYFTRFMAWLNPFGFGPQAATPSSPPAPSPPPQGPPNFSNHLNSNGYSGHHQGYSSSSEKNKNCNPCNKVPWIPIQGEGNSPPSPPPLPPYPIGGPIYGAPTISNQQDFHGGLTAAASQQVRSPDFSFALPETIGQDAALSQHGPLPNPHLYPGPMPPLFKAEPFDYPRLRNNLLDTNLPASSQQSSSASSLAIETKLFSPGGLSSASFQLDSLQNPNLSVLSVDEISRPYRTNDRLHPEDSRNGANSDDLFSSGSDLKQRQPPSSLLINQDLGSGFSVLSNDRDLSYDSSILANSHATPKVRGESEEAAAANAATTTSNYIIHFEESPVLDLQQKTESTTRTLSNFQGFSTNDKTKKEEEPVTATTESTDFTKNIPYSQEILKLDDVSYVPPSAQSGYLWSTALLSTTTTTTTATTSSSRPKESTSLDNLSKDLGQLDNHQFSNRESHGLQEDSSVTFQSSNTVKTRDKQVQVIIPYTSQYTPLPFQQPYGSSNGKVERTQPRKISYAHDSRRDHYNTEESRNEVKVLDPPTSTTTRATTRATTTTTTTTESIFLENASGPSPTIDKATTTTTKLNTSIDVHRLQKNIDNWTIQEYSRGTTLSTVLPNSSRPYLLPSKKIPEEYLTTTESIESAEQQATDSHDSLHENIVKTFALTGFSFNDNFFDQEESANNPLELRKIQSTDTVREDREKQVRVTTTEVAVEEEAEKHDEFSQKKESFHEDEQRRTSSGSPLSTERIYVVTPMSVKKANHYSSTNDIKDRSNSDGKRRGGERERTSTKNDTSTKAAQNQLESIERAYQVLPQAVNNLAVASTGPESVPLWGIMEHEDFASLAPQDQNLRSSITTKVDGLLRKDIPVLYSGHSKVSRA